MAVHVSALFLSTSFLFLLIFHIPVLLVLPKKVPFPVVFSLCGSNFVYSASKDDRSNSAPRAVEKPKWFQHAPETAAWMVFSGQHHQMTPCCSNMLYVQDSTYIICIYDFLYIICVISWSKVVFVTGGPNKQVLACRGAGLTGQVRSSCPSRSAAGGKRFVWFLVRPKRELFWLKI